MKKPESFHTSFSKSPKTINSNSFRIQGSEFHKILLYGVHFHPHITFMRFVVRVFSPNPRLSYDPFFNVLFEILRKILVPLYSSEYTGNIQVIHECTSYMNLSYHSAEHLFLNFSLWLKTYHNWKWEKMHGQTVFFPYSLWIT